MSTEEPPGPSPEQPTTPPGPLPPPPPPPGPAGWGAQGAPPPPPPEGWGAPPPAAPPPEGWGAPGAAPYGQPPYGPQYGGPPQYAYGGGYGYGQETESLAVVSLVLAIASFFTCFILAIVALVLAGKADEYIRSSGGRKTGEGMVRAARIVSWVNIGLTVFFVVLLIGLAFAGAILSD